MEPTAALAALAALAGVVYKLTEILRKYAPKLDGRAVNASSVAIATLLAAGTDTRATVDLLRQWGIELVVAVHPLIDYAITGLIVGLGAGVLADFLTRTDVLVETSPPTNIEGDNIDVNVSNPRVEDDHI